MGKLPESRNRVNFTDNYFPFTDWIEVCSDWTEVYVVHQYSLQILNLSLFAKPVPLIIIFFWFFLNVHALLFLTLSLLNRCQIVTDTFKEMLQSLLASHLNHLFHYTNKNISVKPLFNLHYLSLFQLPFTRSKIVQLMEDLAVITALNQ